MVDIREDSCHIGIMTLLYVEGSAKGSTASVSRFQERHQPRGVELTL